MARERSWGAVEMLLGLMAWSCEMSCLSSLSAMVLGCVVGVVFGFVLVWDFRDFVGFEMLLVCLVEMVCRGVD